MNGIAIVFLFAVVLAIAVMRGESHKKRIYSEIESMGGSVVTIERRNFFAGIGPFHVVGKGRVVYRIVYTMGGEMEEGWVRFGGWMGPDWRL